MLPRSKSSSSSSSNSNDVISYARPLAPLLFCLLVIGAASLDESVIEKSEAATEPRIERTGSLEIRSSQDIEGIEAGSTPSLLCKLSVPGQVWWSTGGRNLTTIKDFEFMGRLDIKKASRNDTGDYKCSAQIAGGELLEKNIHIRVIEPGKIMSGGDVREKVMEAASLTCRIYGYPLSQFIWLKGNDSEASEHLKNFTSVTKINETYTVLTLEFKSLARKDNGTYVCQANDYNGIVSASAYLFVIDVPKVSIDFMKAVGAGSIFLNWTVNDGNEPIKKYFIQHMKNGTDQRQYYAEQIGGGNSSYVLKGFESGTAYQIGISATNVVGASYMQLDPRWITTLEKDPVFVPKVSVNGVTENSITIGWTLPPQDLKEHVHYYNLMATHADQKREAVYPAQPYTLTVYAFVDLDPATTYKFKIAACSEYTKQCGNWSAEVNGTTLDGVASPPKNLTVNCRYDNISSSSFISITWEHPEKPNGIIQRYNIQLSGVARFKNDMGRVDVDSFGPPSWSVKRNSTRYNQIPPNTNYTIRVHGVTRSRTPGKDAIGNCTAPITIPDRDSMNMRSWRKIENQGRHLFKLYLPRISERNGPICCYRIYLVKLPPRKMVGDLPPPEEINVYSYQYVHSSPNGGAYIAETFDSDQLLTEVFLGDGESSNGDTMCDKCIGLRPKPAPPLLHLVPEIQTTVASSNSTSTTTTTASATTSTSTFASTSSNNSTIGNTSTMSTTTVTTIKIGTTTAVPVVNATEKTERRKRENLPVQRPSMDGSGESILLSPYDGFLDETANYTGFIEIIVFDNHKDQFLPAYSSYFNPLYGGMEALGVTAAEASTIKEVIVQLFIALILTLMFLFIALFLVYKYTKRAQEREEVITLRNSFRHLCRSLTGRHQLVAASPPDMPPVPKGDLLQAYLERHRDSDYGFQHEFELLPDRFTDRTTRASEAQENLFKNRYPDIKCYDQTRVRLTLLDGICGSDYINANFVLGYKERKKFICAQGPMENTVCDFWRMIWEQHLELILMLTNLEEYSKTKCAKYWPDKLFGEPKNFGDITVEHVKERTYSDYVVRELRMTRLGERDARTIVQYHFLVWKDFVAPEHPHAILRFIKRVNEAYSLEKGPILVHCSAGVGRTGTLVALDSLLQQLTEEGQVSIFNTVCDLRHQRNFLVQSLKQYIFIYRALMEMAQYGDTEISAPQLKTTVAKLRQRDSGKEKCKMEEEYDKISSVLEDRKSVSVGGGEENRSKNRSESVIPYDRNRVILTPVSGREHSTYINASFIEGYDNTESFIITQDPLETTITDFWRMISEQCISTIVMLSDLNEGPRKFLRYWPDEETDYGHIRVRYIHGESCPYYTRREFCVLNTKTDESGIVKQYQYHGWPTVEGEVPEVTRGLIELVDQTLTNDVETSGSLVVHCSYGSDRSSMFVTLSILVQQLRIEKRVDIFTTTKKLRSQRQGMISTFAQYEFLHRAIVNYSDLHKLADDEPVS